jgi:diaminohydroxyphosphoribosylaminopyrimidine deaminase/5-amino-6-(5-phosphoribosylamino)uracil reductase
MRAAIALGRRWQGLTSPNPSVGSLVVRDGVIVGRGATRTGGRPHAETVAIMDAGEQARGATLYVSLHHLDVVFLQRIFSLFNLGQRLINRT